MIYVADSTTAAQAAARKKFVQDSTDAANTAAANKKAPFITNSFLHGRIGALSINGSVETATSTFNEDGDNTVIAYNVGGFWKIGSGFVRGIYESANYNTTTSLNGATIGRNRVRVSNFAAESGVFMDSTPVGLILGVARRAQTTDEIVAGNIGGPAFQANNPTVIDENAYAGIAYGSPRAHINLSGLLGNENQDPRLGSYKGLRIGGGFEGFLAGNRLRASGNVVKANGQEADFTSAEARLDWLVMNNLTAGIGVNYRQYRGNQEETSTRAQANVGYVLPLGRK
jgi:hypothetical protein